MDYEIKEKENKNKKVESFNYDELLNDVNSKHEEKEKQLSEDKYNSLLLDYELNYNVKQLKMIADYYNLSIRKKKKLEIIHMLIDYETNEENIGIVEMRKTQWFYFNELLSDPFFEKYIITDF